MQTDLHLHTYRHSVSQSTIQPGNQLTRHSLIADILSNALKVVLFLILFDYLLKTVQNNNSNYTALYSKLFLKTSPLQRIRMAPL